MTYTVDDVYDAEQKHGIYPMAATNIEQGKNIIVHPPGVFGFFEGLTKLPFEISIDKPSALYASTSLIPVSATSTNDVFKIAGVDQLYDAPIMYTVPDTATVKVGNCEVLVSVYSPNKKISAKEIAGWMNDLLEAARQYLGGILPADKYAFLYYFKDPSLKHSFPAGLAGALEHNTSSFYYLYEEPQSMQKEMIVDISSHEFFHIITPLTIASKEVKEFNWNKPVLSKHLWLYEGVTEYTAHHVLVKYGLNSVPQFLNKLSGKITNSRTQFNDSLAFTELSTNAADKYETEYGNVYQKGALIAAALDVYLLHLSNGNYDLRNLTYDLGVRYGRNRSFNDDELFSVIGELAYPEAEDFLRKYVGGSTPIPYDYFFGLAGIELTAKTELKLLPNTTKQQQLVQKVWLTANKAQVTETPVANPADVKSIDAIIKATYDVISGPAGPRNWNRFYSLFLPEAKLGSIANTTTGKPAYKFISPDNYKKRNAPFFAQSGFFEEELKRNVSQFGNVAGVQSSYQFRFDPTGKIEQRGVNYFTLVYSEGRWWIANLSWQNETKELPLPAELQKK